MPLEPASGEPPALRGPEWRPPPVCTENSSSGVVVMKSAEDGK
jgi:hypothetical protein